MTIMQVQFLTTEAEEDESESFYSSIQQGTHHAPKEDMLIMTCDWKAK